MNNPDTLITASDELIGEENSYIAIKDIFDPGLIESAECFQVPGTEEYFLDLIFNLNRRYRRRLGKWRHKEGQEIRTRLFKRHSGVVSVCHSLNIQKFTTYMNSSVYERVKELESKKGADV